MKFRTAAILRRRNQRWSDAGGRKTIRLAFRRGIGYDEALFENETHAAAEACMGGDTVWVNVAGCLVLVGAAAGAVILVCVLARRHRRAALAGARRDWEESVARLRADPKNPELKEDALRFGRLYAQLSPERGGRREFTEEEALQAVKALCPPPSRTEPARETLEDRLAQLDYYRKRGLLSESEYQQKKDDLQAEMGPPPGETKWP
jgi:hypothetical protein